MNATFLRDDLKKISQKVFTLVGEYDAEIFVSTQSESLTRFANNIIHQNIARENGSISIRLQKGKKTASVSLGLFNDDETIALAVENAKEIVEHSAENPDLLPMLGAQNYEETDGFCDETASISPTDRANTVEKVVSRCEEEKFSSAGIVENSAFTVGIANTKGLFAFWQGTNFDFDLTVEGRDGTGWAGSKSWSHKNVDVDEDIAEAMDIARRNENPRDIEPGEYTVVLPPAAASELFLFLSIHGFNARAHLENRSFLTGKLGQKVFSDKITIVDDAYNPEEPGMPFDFEGFPKKRVELVKNGVLTGLVYDRLSAEKMNAEPTGHGLNQPNQWGAFAFNLAISPGDASMDDMIKSVKKGLFVTHFHYTNVSELTKLTLTGMTRDGLFVIENGEIAYPVKNLRFTQSVAEALNNVVAVGKERKLVSGFFFGGVRTPGLLIEKFNFSSATEFAG